MEQEIKSTLLILWLGDYLIILYKGFELPLGECFSENPIGNPGIKREKNPMIAGTNQIIIRFPMNPWIMTEKNFDARIQQIWHWTRVRDIGRNLLPIELTDCQKSIRAFEKFSVKERSLEFHTKDSCWSYPPALSCALMILRLVHLKKLYPYIRARLSCD
jgi:hypothetical protein